MTKKSLTHRALTKGATLMALMSATMFGGAITSAQDGALAQGATDTSASEKPLYYHAYKPALTGTFQLQPGQGYAVVEPFAGFVRMVQVCVRDARATGAMPVPAPMLATLSKRGTTEHRGVISVGSCGLLEGDSISLGIADGTVDPDTSDENSRKALSYMQGSYTILGYYSHEKPVVSPSKE